MCGSDAVVVELVAIDSDAYTMDFLFVRTEGGNEAAICDFVAAWNCRWSYEVNGVGASGHAGADTLGQLIQTDLFGPRLGWWYSRAWPVLVSMTELDLVQLTWKRSR